RCKRKPRTSSVRGRAISQPSVLVMGAILRRLSRLQSHVRKNFLCGVSDEPLLSKQEMLEVPPQPVTRRNLLEGGYTVALLSLAIVVCYGILASGSSPAASASPSARL